MDEAPRPNVKQLFNEGWEFAESEANTWLFSSVPGSVQQDLIRHGLLVDPRIDSNEFIVEALEQKDWIFRKKFSRSDLPERKFIQFYFEGLDTYCDVFLNDSLVAQSNNMFLPLEVTVPYEEFQEENLLELRFKSTVAEGIAARGDRLHGLTAGNDSGEEQVSPFVRKAPYQFGWDWAPRVLTTGIWKDIVVLSQDEFLDIKIGYQYIISKDNGVSGFVHMDYSCPERGFKVVAKGPWGELTDSIRSNSCPSSILFDFEIANADLWTIDEVDYKSTPVDIQIFDGDVMVRSEQIEMSFRAIALIQAPDSIGTSFSFTLNGEERFIKGANYIPQSMFPSEVSDDDYRRLLTQVKESNIDMLRVWGGGIYEKDIFYNLCDSLGILVWQDLMFAGAMYPTDALFLQSVRQEVNHQHERLRNHPCIVLWCGNNEVDVAWKNWGWQETLNMDSLHAQAEYDQLFRGAVSDPLYGEAYVHTSPLSNWGRPENFKHHNMHYWGVWHGTDDFEGFEKNVPRFMSEYGFQSFPMPATFEGEVDPSEWRIDSPSMRHRQKSYKGTKELERHLYQHYPRSDNFERFCYLSQLNQALAMELAINAHRGAGGHCMGSLYWQLNDVWAAPSWSTIDVSGNWKAAHYTVKDRYKDVIAIAREEDEALRITVVNDRAKVLAATLKIEHLDFEGRVLFENESTVSVSARKDDMVYSLPLAELALDPIRKTSTAIRFTVLENDIELDESIHYFCEPKDLILPALAPDDIKVDVIEQGKFRFSSSKFCKDVFLYLPQSRDAVWSDNCFDLFPGESKTVEFTGDQLIGDIRLLYLNENADGGL